MAKVENVEVEEVERVETVDATAHLNLLFSTQFLLANGGLAQTARGQNYFSRQPTCFIGGQEHCDRCDVRGLPDAT